jgi:hypothetical protein
MRGVLGFVTLITETMTLLGASHGDAAYRGRLRHERSSGETCRDPRRAVGWRNAGVLHCRLVDDVWGGLRPPRVQGPQLRLQGEAPRLIPSSSILIGPRCNGPLAFRVRQNRTVAIVHAVLSAILALVLVVMQKPFEIGAPNTPNQKLVLQISCGYFLYDWVACTLNDAMNHK